MTTNFNLVSHDGTRVLSVLHEGELHVVTDKTHANINEMVEALAHDEWTPEFLDLGKYIEKEFNKAVEGRVRVEEGQVYFDDEPIRGKITERLLAFVDEGLSITPLVKFLENIMANPQEHSREQFYRWIETHDFPIDEDGCIVAFKGVRSDHTSIHAGPAYVNGEYVNGYVPNDIGSTVSMPRGDVQHDPTVACHTGLHAGTWSYANNFAQGAVMHVKINPRDVVSVPNDCRSQKVRVCRYEVLSFATADYQGSYYTPESETLDDEDFEEEFDGEVDEDSYWYASF